LVICNLNFSSVIWGFKQTPRKWMSGCIECRWICPSRFVYMLIFSSVIWGFKQTPGKWMLGCIECRWICPSRFVHMFIFSICHLGVSITSQKLMLRCFDTCSVIFIWDLFICSSSQSVIWLF
jgi:hypothetical protein